MYCQLEADVDDVLAAQTVKCLVHLSKEMLEADRAAGLVPKAMGMANGGPAVPSEDAASIGTSLTGDLDKAIAELASDARHQNGADAADSDAESEEDEQQMLLAGAPGLTLQGLVRRMAKMAGDRSVSINQEPGCQVLHAGHLHSQHAEDRLCCIIQLCAELSPCSLCNRLCLIPDCCCRTFHRQLHRMWALKFVAALTTRLGKDGIVPHLNQIMQPLYRIQESGSAPNTDEVCEYLNLQAPSRLSLAYTLLPWHSTSACWVQIYEDHPVKIHFCSRSCHT